MTNESCSSDLELNPPRIVNLLIIRHSVIRASFDIRH